MVNPGQSFILQDLPDDDNVQYFNLLQSGYISLHLFVSHFFVFLLKIQSP